MTSSTSDLTMVPNAPPMMMPTAKSTTFPRMANALNSLNILRASLEVVGHDCHPDISGARSRR